MVVDQQLQQTPIAGIEAPMIHAVQAQGLSHQGLINGSTTTATHAGHIPHPAQQAVGNPGCTAAGGRNAAAGLRCEGDPDQPGGALDDRFQVVLAVKLQALDQAKPVPQRGAQRSGAGGGPHKGEGRQVEGTGSCCAALAHGEIEATVFHRRIEQLLRHPAQAMNLVNEQQITGLQVDQQPNDVARAFQGRCTGDLALHPHLFGQHHGHGGFAQARRAIEQHMIEGIAAAKRRFHRNAQHLLELALADVVVQALGPKLVFRPTHHLFRCRLGVHQRFRAAWWLATGAGGDNRHAGRVPRPG